MANTSGVQQAQHYPQQQQQQQQQGTNPHQCKECGLFLDSAESLDVHLQYTHKENLLNKWAAQATGSHSEETNNNNTKTNAAGKREFMINNTIAAAADSSDSKKSPEYSRATPENMFGHPPTPQSYQSASSPYQNQDNSTFSPNFPNYTQQVKVERLSPSANHFQNNYANYNDQQFFPPMDTPNQHSNYNQEYPVHKNPVSNNSYRYHPYQQSQHGSFERPQPQSQVTSSSPAYPPQPTPSPSPKTCDKCGLVCDSASQLIDHLNIAHPPTPAPHLSSFQTNQHFMFGNDGQQMNQVKLEDDSQSEILDLDSHKVHQVFPEDEKRQNGDPNNHNPHSVSALIGNWSPQNQKLFQQDQRLFMNNQDQKMFAPNEQKMFQAHQEYMANGSVTTSTQEPLGHSPNYRPFEHLPSQPNTPVISSTQVPNAPTPTAPPSTKSASWKSNEARRPKTYNCTACNKWFTSSGHLKRHYNTTLHKNAVKSSGQPDPASLPISAHHHPARDNANREDRTSNSPGEDSRDDGNSLPPQFERPSPMPGLLQQPPNGPYDRQPAPNIHQPPPLHSPMAHNSPLVNPMVSLNNLATSNGSPPNGEAGPSALNLDSRGLLSLSANHNTAPGFNMAPPMMPMESNQFQMYPNESAPHVTQDMATNSLNTTGELQFITDNSTAQPLPSFAQIQAHRPCGLVLSYGNANVGGGGPATAPYTYFTETSFENIEPRIIYKTDEFEDEYKLTIPTPSDQLSYQNENNENIMQYDPSQPQYSPTQDFQNNNNIDEEQKMQMKIGLIKMKLEAQPESPEKAHIKRDYEETTGSPRISSTVRKTPEPFKCYECEKYFNKACYLTQHNKTFHCGDKPFKCQRCGKRFSDESTYQEHSAKHAGEKPHKCDLCPKQFNHKTDLRRHMCLHTGQKPYACETCGKGFIRKDHMLKHCETHTRKAQLKASGGLR